MSAPTSWWQLKSSVTLNYGIAVVSAAVALALSLALRSFIGSDPSIPLFLCAAMVVGLVCGPGPALLSTTLAAAAVEYFFLQPIYSFAAELKEVSTLAIFVVTALLVVFLSATQQRTTDSLKRVRDELQGTIRRLQELNEELRVENGERKQAEENARRAEKELQVTVDTMPVLAARYRADGFMEFRNENWRSYTGLSKENIEGGRWGSALHPDDAQLVELEWHKHIATGEPFDLEQRLRRADGEYRWHWVRRVPLRDEHGAVTKWYGVALDIDNRKRAENALRQSEAELAAARHELQLMIDTVPVLVLRHRADGIIDFVNQSVREYSGLDSTSWTKRTTDTTHPDDVSRLARAWDVALATGEAFETEQRVRRADGEYHWFVTRRVPLRNRDGDVIAWYAASFDIEDRKRAEEAFRASEAQLATVRRELELTIDSIPVMVSTFESDGTRSFVNKTWQDYTGHNQQEATGEGLNTSIYYHPDDVQRFDDAWRKAIATGEMLSIDVRTRRADGIYRWYTMRRAPHRDEQGNIVKWYSVGVDVEDQRAAEDAVRRSEEKLASAERELRLTLDSIPTLAWRARPDGSAEYLNRRWLDYTGFSLDQALGWEWQAAIHPDDRAGLRKAWLEMLESGKPGDVEARMRRYDGAYRWFLFRTEASLDEAGRIVGWYGTNTDIEDRKQMESALQRSEAYSAEAQKLSRTGSLAWDIANDEHFWSDETYQIMGVDRTVKPTLDLIAQRVHPDDRPHLRHEAYRAANGADNFDYQQRLVMPDGQIKYLHVRAHRVKYDTGKEEIVGALMDVTATRKSQEDLAAAHAALAQANRVATLGEVSATIAHEVNQPLAAIVANGQACLRFLRRDPPNLDDVRGAMEWIIKDGNRASEIIKRVRGLLKKADADKLPLDVNDVLREVVVLLQREMDAKRVTLQVELAPTIPMTIADRVQLQQVIINLIVNGAESMQQVNDRPRLLEVRSYEDDEKRIVISVRDNGVGIPAEIADRLFDPFITTKTNGLGIGLSICRSIIQDHGGELWVTDNSDGPGAAFRFNLPAQRSLKN